MANPASFARRNAIAIARGFKSFFEWRVASASHPPDLRVKSRRMRGGEEFVYTRSEGTLRAAIFRAARNDLMIYARVTILEDPEDGTRITEWPKRDVEILSKGGWRAENMVDFIGTNGIALGVLKDILDEMDKYPGPILDVLLRAVAA